MEQGHEVTMSEWTDTYRKGDLTGAEVEYGIFRLSVHHWRGCGDIWFVSCYGIIDNGQLKAKKLSEAKTQAKGILRKVLEKAVQEMKGA